MNRLPLVALATTLALWAGPAVAQVRVLTDDEISRVIGQLAEEDFEGEPVRGIQFHDPRVDPPYRGFCSSPTCTPDKDNREGGNITLSLLPGGTISFDEPAEFVVLDVQGIGDDPFELVVREGRGECERVRGQGVLFGVVLFGLTSPSGITSIEVRPAELPPAPARIPGDTGGIVLARVLFSPPGGGLRTIEPVTIEGVDDKSLAPDVVGEFRRFPELGAFHWGATGLDNLGSAYARTTAQNREFVRGNAEFSIPSAPIVNARLVLRQWVAYSPEPELPDLHQVFAYTPADLAITVEDYDRTGTLVGTISTDHHDKPRQVFELDVTRLAVAAAGGTLGFLVKLDVDPAESAYRGLGATFMPSLEIVTSPVPMGFAFAPDPLQPPARSRWVTGYLERATPFAVADIDIASIRLNGVVPVDPTERPVLGDQDCDDIPDLMVRFDRAAVEATVSEGRNVPMTITGTVRGQPFSGVDYIVVRGRAIARDPGRGRFDLTIRGATPSDLRNGQLRVDFTLPESSPARIEVYDVAGRMLASREVGAFGAGDHTLDLSTARGFASGIYLMRLTQGAQVVRARAAVLR